MKFEILCKNYKFSRKILLFFGAINLFTCNDFSQFLWIPFKTVNNTDPQKKSLPYIVTWLMHFLTLKLNMTSKLSVYPQDFELYPKAPWNYEKIFESCSGTWAIYSFVSFDTGIFSYTPKPKLPTHIFFCILRQWKRILP